MRRAVHIYLPMDEDLVATIRLFTQIANELSKKVWEMKEPIRHPLALRKRYYHALRAQYPQVASRVLEYIIKIVAGCYSPKKFRKLDNAVEFKKDFALFDKRLFKIEGDQIVLWTINGRKRYPFVWPKVGRFQKMWECKEDVDSITLQIKKERIVGYVCLTVPAGKPREVKHIVVSIPQWCDCCVMGRDWRDCIFLKFQSHNGAIAAEVARLA